MAIELLIIHDGKKKVYNVRQGLTITQNYNETLDSVELVISHIKEPIDIEPYDECILNSDVAYEGFLFSRIDTKYHMYMCVDKYDRKQLSVGQDAYYEYQISLFSQTKLLEGIILPNLKITRGTMPKNVLSYLEKYLQDYAPKYRSYRTTIHGDELTWDYKWQYSDKVKNRFKSIVCPEMQWNNPTLRQVITDLMMVDDCIPVLRNNFIDLIDLTKKGNQLRLNNNNNYYINYVEQSQSSDDYVSELRMDVKNAISEKDKLVEVCEYIGFRNSDVGILNDSNVRLETQHPIYDLVSLKAHCFLTCSNLHSQEKRPDGSSKHVKAILNFIGSVDLVEKGICCENAIRQVKPVYALDWDEPANNYTTMAKYQNLNFYYNRGDNKILGFNDKTKVIFVGQREQYNFLTLEQAIAFETRLIPFEGVIYEALNIPVVIPEDLTNLYFEIKYRTTADALFQAGKKVNPTNNRIVVDNQTNSYVDANAQGLLEYLKANRLGNKMLLINGRYERKSGDTSFIGRLGDTYEDSIIFRKQTSIFDDYALVNYYATKDYVLRDYFTGVQAKQRSWKLVSGNDALVRNDLLKYYFQFSFKEPQPEFLDKNIPNYSYLSTAFAYLPNAMLYAFATKEQINSLNIFDYSKLKGSINFIDKNAHTYPTNQLDSYYVELVKRNMGNSLVFTFNLQDSIYVGRGILQQVEGGYAQKPLRYADKNGENVGGRCNIGLYKNIDETIISFDNATSTYEGENNPYKQIDFNDEINMKPLVTQDQKPQNYAFELSFPFGFDKDNAEITQISVQLECCVRKGDDIEIGKEFFKLQPLISEFKSYPSIKVYYSNTKQDINKPITELNVYKNNFAKISLGLYQYSDSAYGIHIEDCSFGEYTYIVNDDNDKIILAFATQNKESVEPYDIYFSPLLSRDEKIYNEDGTITSIYD